MIFYRPRIWLYFALALVLTTSCLQQKSSLVLDEDAPDQSMKNATIQYTDSGRLQMITWGAEILFFDDEEETQEFTQGVEATFYGEKGKVNSIITADEATNWQKKKLMHLRKNVVINDLKGGARTYTEEFFWDQDAGRLYSKVHVLRITKDGSRWQGSGFESDENMDDFRLIRPRLDIVVR